MSAAQGPDFRTFLASLAASAAAGLQVVEQALAPPSGENEGAADPPEDRGPRIAEGLAQARYVIDALAMLEQKTAGNLTDEEAAFLRAAVTDLRIAFVRVNDQARAAPPKSKADPGDTTD